MLEQAFITIASLSVVAAVMVGLALVIRGLLAPSPGRVGRGAFVLMWLLIFCRAVAPVTFEVPAAVSSAVWKGDVTPLQRLAQAVLPAGDEFSWALAAPGARDNALDNAASYRAETDPAAAGSPEPSPAVTAPGTMMMAETPGAALSAGAQGADSGHSALDAAPTAGLAAGAASAAPGGDWPFIPRGCALLWALVAAILLLGLVLSYRHTLRKVRRLPDGEIPEGFAALKARCGVKRTVRIKRGRPGEAAVYGILKPIIVLDHGHPEYREHILTHELVHIRRQDNLKQLFARLVIALHWFNPLLWLAGRLLRQDIELACDQQVLKILGCTQKKAYAGSLYDCARQQTAASRGFAYFGKNPVRARVKNVLAFRGSTITAPVIAIALAVFVLAGCIANPAAGLPRLDGGEPAAAEAAAVVGYEASYAFYDLQLPRETGMEIVAYCPAGEFIYYVYNNLNRDSYGLGYSELATGNNQWLFTGYGKTAYGGLHLAAGRLYYCVRDAAADPTEIMAYDIDGRRAELVTARSDPGQAIRLYGDEQYLCWYENDALVLWSLATGAAQAHLTTNGAQDYANILDGYVALQQDAGPMSGGAVDVVRYHLATGAILSVRSILPETCSVYANADYIVYKEDYKRGAEIAVYRAREGETYRLWEAVAAGVSAEEAAAWQAGTWGINLLHDRLFLTGANNAVLVIELDDFRAELLTDDANHNSGFYEAQVGGDHLAAVQAAPDKTGSNQVLNRREPRLFYAAVTPVYAENQE